MYVSFAESIPKEAAYPNENEDAFEIASHMGRIAVSDGATVSYASKKWSLVLTKRYVENPELNESWITDALAEYVRYFDVPAMSFSQQAAYEAGSFATLLGVESFADHNTVNIISIGDSLAVLLDGARFIESFSYTHADDFKKRPELLGTLPEHNIFFQSVDFFTYHQKTWCLDDLKEPVILCMTDALAEWALRNAQAGRPVWQMLTQVKTLSDFESLVAEERHAKNMNIDDTTLVRFTMVP
jgi:hypothetical protein